MTLRAAVRDSAEARVAAVALGAFLGTALGLVHPLGFLVGGWLAAFAQRSTLRGVGAGFLAGLLAWLAFLAGLASTGSVAPALAATAPLLVSLAVPLAFGALGGLLRGVY